MIPSILNINPFIRFEPLSEGFTLIELLTTVAVAAILGLIAVPSMRAIIQNHRLNVQSNDLLADFTVARSEAVRRGSTVTVCKRDPASATPSCDLANTTPWSGGWIVFIDSVNPATGQVDANEEILRVRDVLEGGNFATSANTATALPGTENAAVRVRFVGSGASSIDPTSAAPAGASAGAPTGIARFRFCDVRGVSNALTLELTSMGRPRVNSTRPFDPNTCPTTSNW
jgi:type IV fimbrial biogenesis protein FimT